MAPGTRLTDNRPHGDAVVDDAGEVIVLDAAADPPQKIRPAGCNSTDCAVDYAGGEVELELHGVNRLPVAETETLKSIILAVEELTSEMKHSEANRLLMNL